MSKQKSEPESMPQLPHICEACGVQQFADGKCANCGKRRLRSQPHVAEAPDLTAWQIVYNALESEGSKVIYDSEAGRVVYCPNSSGCENTPDHEPDCWLGQAMRLIPTSNTLPPVPTSSITEKAQRAAVKILANSTHYPCLKKKGHPECAMCENTDRRRQFVTDIIAAEFQDSNSSGPMFQRGPNSGSGSTYTG